MGKEANQLEIPFPADGTEPLADNLLWELIRDEYMGLLVTEGFYSPGYQSTSEAADRDVGLFRKAVENVGCKVLAIRRKGK